MAFLKLEDFSGVLEVTLFPKVFYQTINIAVVDEIVVIEGCVEKSGEVIAEKITRAEEYAADYWLTIPAQIENPATLDALKKIFLGHAGDSRVYLRRRGVWERIGIKISDDLGAELSSLLGVENVRRY